MSPGLCESLLLLPALGPVPLMPLPTLLTPIAPYGCIDPSDGLLDLNKGEGEDREDKAPLVDVCTAGSEGRLKF